jgi:hypothetical protein
VRPPASSLLTLPEGQASRDETALDRRVGTTVTIWIPAEAGARVMEEAA